MPFYEYECPSCRRVAEVMQKISDAPLRKCPSCGKSGLKRLVSAPVFRLKGSGWYETDFKSDQEGKRNLAGADKDDVKAPADTKAEPASTPAAATAAKSTPAADKPAASRKSVAGKGARTAAKARPVKTAPVRRAGGNKSPARRK